MSLKLSLPGVARCHWYRIAVGGAEVGPNTARRLLLTTEGPSRLIEPVMIAGPGLKNRNADQGFGAERCSGWILDQHSRSIAVSAPGQRPGQRQGR